MVYRTDGRLEYAAPAPRISETTQVQGYRWTVAMRNSFAPEDLRYAIPEGFPMNKPPAALREITRFRPCGSRA